MIQGVKVKFIGFQIDSGASRCIFDDSGVPINFVDSGAIINFVDTGVRIDLKALTRGSQNNSWAPNFQGAQN